MKLIPPDELVFIDFEATSGDIGRSQPIEVGAYLADGQTYHSYILPPVECDDWTIKAQKVHGISREFLQAQGRSAVEVAAELYEFARDKTGHGRLFTSSHENDHVWMIRLFENAGLSFLPCKYKPMIELIGKDEHPDEYLRAHEVIQNMELEQHLALEDAKAVGLEYKMYYELVLNKLTVKSAMGGPARQSFFGLEQNN